MSGTSLLVLRSVSLRSSHTAQIDAFFLIPVTPPAPFVVDALCFTSAMIPVRFSPFGALIPAVSSVWTLNPSSFGNVFLHAPELNKYKLLRMVGRGGFGQVWVAERLMHCQGDRGRVAIKMIRKGNAKSLRSFMEEVSILRFLSISTHTPVFLESFFDNRFLYIVQEFVSDVSLHDKLKSPGRLNEVFVRGLLCSLVCFIFTV